MYDRKKLTIKGRFSDVCFLQKMLFRPKDWSFTPPENLLGDHRNHRGKCENRGFSPAQQMDQFYLKISPENEKNDQKTGRWRILKMVEVAGIEPASCDGIAPASTCLAVHDCFSSRRVVARQTSLWLVRFLSHSAATDKPTEPGCWWRFSSPSTRQGGNVATT